MQHCNACGSGKDKYLLSFVLAIALTKPGKDQAVCAAAVVLPCSITY